MHVEKSAIRPLFKLDGVAKQTLNLDSHLSPSKVNIDYLKMLYITINHSWKPLSDLSDSKPV